MANMFCLPAEILAGILGFLSPKDSVTVLHSCRQIAVHRRDVLGYVTHFQGKLTPASLEDLSQRLSNLKEIKGAFVGDETPVVFKFHHLKKLTIEIYNASAVDFKCNLEELRAQIAGDPMVGLYSLFFRPLIFSLFAGSIPDRAASARHWSRLVVQRGPLPPAAGRAFH